MADRLKNLATVTDPSLLQGSDLRYWKMFEKIDEPNKFLDASRKVVCQGNKITLTETVRTLDARLAASEAAHVAEAFRKLQTHREYAFSVSIPSLPSPASSSPGPLKH